MRTSSAAMTDMTDMTVFSINRSHARVKIRSYRSIYRACAIGR